MWKKDLETETYRLVIIIMMVFIPYYPSKSTELSGYFIIVTVSFCFVNAHKFKCRYLL